MDQTPGRLDALFHALGDPTRRAILQRLAEGPASVSELAGPFGMALPSFLEHIQRLETAGLVETRKSGRVRTVALVTGAFAPARTWLDEQRRAWSARLDRLDEFVTRRAPPEPQKGDSK